MVRKGVAPAAREQMVAAAAGLFGRRGVVGTSFSEIVRASGAPRGSIYYYFPQGKRQLVDDAVRWTTQAVLAYQGACRARTPAGVIDHFIAFFRSSLASSECRNGCPLAAVAIGPSAPAEAIHASVRPGFVAWEALLTRQLRSTGLTPARARGLSTATLAAVEGALILARAEGSLRPLEAVARHLRRASARGR